MQQQFGESDFVWLVGSLCRLHQRPFEPELLLEQYPPPHDLAGLERALDALGLTARQTRLDARTLKRVAPPFVAFLRSDAAEPGADLALCTAVLILGADAERVLCFRPGTDEPQTLGAADFLGQIDGTVLTVGRKPASDAELADAGDGSLLRQPFGFRWFVPALLRHKRIWRDVLLASLAIQLLGLGLPIFTQVVIENEP